MKPDRISTLEGIYVLDSTGHYIPEAERDEPLKYRGIIIIGAAFLLWIIFIGIAIEAVQACGAVFG